MVAGPGAQKHDSAPHKEKDRIMQTYRTVAEVVDFLKTYHQQLQNFFLKYQDTVNSERLKMLLDYIRRHENNIQYVLETINEKDRDIILKTWIQFVPFTETILPEEQLTDPNQDIDSIVQQVFELDDNLIRFYDKMIHQAGVSGPGKEFFQHLISLEEKQKTQISEAAQQIKAL
jgi:uncharacterized protein (UPF0335 family)